MNRSLKGQAIRPERRTRAERGRLRVLLRRAKASGDLDTWRRAKAVRGYLSGERVIAMAESLDVSRVSINRWLQWFNAKGTDGLKPRKAPGPPCRLTEAQRAELVSTIEAGPLSAGYLSGLWTGPMIGELIWRRYGVKYHHQHVPRLLHSLGFSVQRPRKLLCRADHERQAVWLRETFPSLKKKPVPAAE
jgi:transposase